MWPMEQLKPCMNPACERKTAGADFCCGPCSQAYRDGYEIHESGPLAHSEGCNKRHALRSASTGSNHG